MPAILAQDPFTRANAGTLGANWTSLLATAMSVVSNAADVAGAGSNILDSYNLDIPDNQFAEATVTRIDAGAAIDEGIGVMVRASGSGASVNAYVMVVSGAGLNNMMVGKIIAGTLSPFLHSSLTVNVGDVIRLEAVGQSINMYLNGSFAGGTGDSTLTGGRAGVAFLATSDGALDNWSAGQTADLPIPELIGGYSPYDFGWRGLSQEQFRDIAMPPGSGLVDNQRLRKRAIRYENINEVAYFGPPADLVTTVDYIDSAEIYVDIQASGTELQEAVDSATVAIDIQVGTFAPGVITVDQPDLGHNLNVTGTGLAVSFTTTQPVAAGATIVVPIAWGGDTAGVSTISGGGLTWTIDRNALGGDTGGQRYAFVSAYAPLGLSAGTVITATWAAGFTGSYMIIGGMSFFGIPQSSKIDGTPPVNHPVAGTNTAWSATGQTVQAGSVVVSLMAAGPETGTNTPDSPQLEAWEFADVPNSNLMVMQYRIVSSTGSYTMSGVLSSSTTNYNAAQMAYLVNSSVPVDTLQAVDSATVYVDLQASGTDVYTPASGAVYTDADTALVDIQASGTELREVTDATTVPITISVLSTEVREVTDTAIVLVDIQSSGTELREITDAATVPLDIAATGTELQEFVESAQVYVDIQAIGTELREVFDAVEVYYDIQVSAVEDYVKPPQLLIPNGDVTAVNWQVAPLYPKLSDSSNVTYIFAVAV